MRLTSEQVELGLRVRFEGELPRRVQRAMEVGLQDYIPAHWFAAAASECASMYVTGFFYGSISVAQAYVEAVSEYLIREHGIRLSKDVPLRWTRLREADVVSWEAEAAAVRVFSGRNGFHHLNRDVEQDYWKLEARAKECVNDMHAIEAELFGYSVEPSGGLHLANERYWPRPNSTLTQVHIRSLW